MPDKVRCGLEGCRTPHNKGFVVAFRTGKEEEQQKGIVGHVCGKKRFGLGWVDAQRAYRARLAVADMTDAMELFQERAGHILPAIQTILPRLRWQRDVRKVLETHAPDVLHVCGEAVKSRHGRMSLQSNSHENVLHVLKGDGFWIDYRAYTRAQTLRVDIERFQERLQTGLARPLELRGRLSGFADIEHRWKLVISGMEAADEALTTSHLDQTFKAANQILAVRDGQYRNVSISRNAPWRLSVKVTDAGLAALIFDIDRGHFWGTAIALAGPPSITRPNADRAAEQNVASLV